MSLKHLPIKTIYDIIASGQALRPVSLCVNHVKEDMRQSKTGAASLNHRLQSLFAFWSSVYCRPIAVHTAVGTTFLAPLSNWGEQVLLSGISLSEIRI